jgi:DNA-directed RNA polymerase subunit beta'
VHRAYETGSPTCRRACKVRIRRARGATTARVRAGTRTVDTTVGRALLSEVVPKGMSFDVVNRDMTKKAISASINECYRSSASRRP